MSLSGRMCQDLFLGSLPQADLRLGHQRQAGCVLRTPVANPHRDHLDGQRKPDTQALNLVGSGRDPGIRV